MEERQALALVNAVIGGLVALVGIACVLEPGKVQQFILRQKSDRLAWKLNPFVPLMETPEYRSYLRFMGAILLFFGGMGLYGLWRAYR